MQQGTPSLVEKEVNVFIGMLRFVWQVSTGSCVGILRYQVISWKQDFKWTLCQDSGSLGVRLEEFCLASTPLCSYIPNMKTILQGVSPFCHHVFPVITICVSSILLPNKLFLPQCAVGQVYQLLGCCCAITFSFLLLRWTSWTRATWGERGLFPFKNFTVHYEENLGQELKAETWRHRWQQWSKNNVLYQLVFRDDIRLFFLYLHGSPASGWEPSYFSMTSHYNHLSGKLPIDMATRKFDGENSSTEMLSLQMCVGLCQFAKNIMRTNTMTKSKLSWKGLSWLKISRRHSTVGGKAEHGGRNKMLADHISPPHTGIKNNSKVTLAHQSMPLTGGQMQKYWRLGEAFLIQT